MGSETSIGVHLPVCGRSAEPGSEDGFFDLTIRGKWNAFRVPFYTDVEIGKKGVFCIGLTISRMTADPAEFPCP